MAGKEPIVAIFDADAFLEQIDKKILAHTYVLNIKEAIERYRRDRDPDRLLRVTVYSILLTGAFIGLLFLLAFLYRKLFSLLESRYKKKIQSLKIQSLNIGRAERI